MFPDILCGLTRRTRPLYSYASAPPVLLPFVSLRLLHRALAFHLSLSTCPFVISASGVLPTTIFPRPRAPCTLSCPDQLLPLSLSFLRGHPFPSPPSPSRVFSAAASARPLLRNPRLCPSSVPNPTFSAVSVRRGRLSPPSPPPLPFLRGAPSSSLPRSAPPLSCPGPLTCAMVPPPFSFRPIFRLLSSMRSHFLPARPRPAMFLPLGCFPLLAFTLLLQFSRQPSSRSVRFAASSPLISLRGLLLVCGFEVRSRTVSSLHFFLHPQLPALRAVCPAPPLPPLRA